MNVVTLGTSTSAATPDLFAWVGAPLPPAGDPPPRRISDGLSLGYPSGGGERGPGFKTAGPSAEAAAKIAPHVTRIAKQILDYLKIRPYDALTSDQIAHRLNISPFTVRPRLTELKSAGLVEAADERGVSDSGSTASRWRPTRQAVSS